MTGGAFSEKSLSHLERDPEESAVEENTQRLGDENTIHARINKSCLHNE